MRGAVRHYFGGGAAALNMHERLSEVLMLAVTSAMEDAGKLSLQLAGSASSR